MRLVDQDPTVPFLTQLAENVGPVTLVNTFDVPLHLTEAFRTAWAEDGMFMKAQPGFVSAQLHRATSGSRMWLNIAVWETTEALRTAFHAPEFQQAAAKYPDGIVATPHVYQAVAMPGICVAR